MKLVSCNIEGRKHLEERVIPFLEREKPDLVCLQEVFEADMPRLQEVLGMEGQYQPMADVDRVSIHQDFALGSWGVAVFSTLENPQFHAHYYVRLPDELPIFFENDDPNSMHRVILAVTGMHQNHEVTVATTHFTWSPKGSFTQEQQTAFESLEKVLDGFPPHILCGDFNSPRIWQDDQQIEYEQNVFGKLASKYQDNIPKEVTTSIDGNLHKAGSIELMVDGLFSDAAYKVKDVRVVGGVSDHKALAAEVILE